MPNKFTDNATHKILDAVQRVANTPYGNPRKGVHNSIVNVSWGTLATAWASGDTTVVIQPCAGANDSTPLKLPSGSTVPTIHVHISLPLGSSNRYTLLASVGDILAYYCIGDPDPSYTSQSLFVLWQPPLSQSMLIPLSLSQDGGSDGGFVGGGGVGLLDNGFSFPSYTYTALNAVTGATMGTSLAPQARMFPGSCHAAYYGLGYTDGFGNFKLLIAYEWPNVNICDNYDGEPPNSSSSSSGGSSSSSGGSSSSSGGGSSSSSSGGSSSSSSGGSSSSSSSGGGSSSSSSGGDSSTSSGSSSSSG